MPPEGSGGGLVVRPHTLSCPGFLDREKWSMFDKEVRVEHMHGASTETNVQRVYHR